MFRRKSYVTYLLVAAVLVLAYSQTRTPWVLCALGPVVAFFGTGYFSGFGAVTAELYPTEVRATAQGFTYNVGRIASASAPWLVGSVADTSGYPAALAIARRRARAGRDVLDRDSGDEGPGYFVICVICPIR